MKSIMQRKILWGELDSLGIVFYPRYYEWMDAAGHLFFDAINLNLGRLMEERNIQFPLIQSGCKHKTPGRYYDDIQIITELASLTKKTLELHHHIVRSCDSTLLVEGFEKRICLDISNPHQFRAITIPQDIYTVLEQAR
ncbi:MAG: hypothetical protein DRG63_03865 [Deltaproteobacteria bacterium]|nr:MAG: hypothetical protein DRG63_03865 [Deltaproteobacteria bacterium]